MLSRKYRIAFTLAEILITLTIIGVVAAITIPAVSHNIQEMQFHVALRKTFVDIDQATKRIMLENGGTMKNVCSTTTCIRDKYANYLSYFKSCTTATTLGNCWHTGSDILLSNSPYNGLGNTGGLVLNDGVCLRFDWGTSAFNCDSVEWWGHTPKCGVIDIDVNGVKQPNIIGRDIYVLFITKNSVEPLATSENTDSDSWLNNCTTSGSGIGCSAKYLKE